jgi:hypothetical protein
MTDRWSTWVVTGVYAGGLSYKLADGTYFREVFSRENTSPTEVPMDSAYAYARNTIQRARDGRNWPGLYAVRVAPYAMYVAGGELIYRDPL